MSNNQQSLQAPKQEMTVLEKALILSYLHSDQLIKSLETALLEMKAYNDPRTGRFQSLLEKLQGAAKRAYANIESNMQNKEEFHDEMWDLLGEIWQKL